MAAFLIAMALIWIAGNLDSIEKHLKSIVELMEDKLK